MEIYVFSRPDMVHGAQELGTLLEHLERYLPQYKVNRPLAAVIETLTGLHMPFERIYDTMPDEGRDRVAVSYGGDGTLLDCVRAVGMSGMPVLGINSGRLGFLANVPAVEAGDAFAMLARGEFTTEQRPLIEARGGFIQEPEYPFAFNEFSLQRGGASMVAVEVRVDSQLVATYWGDGAMLSTPTGSTAYSLSVGGPVVVPGCDCFVISPIAPHNLTMRPVVIPVTSEVTMRVRARGEEPYATLDNLTFPVANGAEFRLVKAKNFISLVKLHNISFYDTLRNKMMWGLDKRDE